MAKYKHIKTGKIAERHPNLNVGSYQVSGFNTYLPAEFVEDSLDWEEIEDYLFITSDGVKIKHNDNYYWVNPHDTIVHSQMATVGKLSAANCYSIETQAKDFSTRPLAEKYLVENARVISLNDLKGLESYKRDHGQLIRLIRDKLKLP